MAEMVGLNSFESDTACGRSYSINITERSIFVKSSICIVDNYGGNVFSSKSLLVK